jgi:hypothetical protein
MFNGVALIVAVGISVWSGLGRRAMRPGGGTDVAGAEGPEAELAAAAGEEAVAEPSPGTQINR